MAANNFVYWSDGLEGRAFDHHRRNGGRGICQQKLPAGPVIWTIFSNARGMLARGWNWLTHNLLNVLSKTSNPNQPLNNHTLSDRVP